MAVLALCGCGGDDGGGKEGYLPKGDALCRSINATVAKEAKPTNDPAERARQYRAILAAAERARRRFGELTPPAARRGLVTRFLAAFDAKLDAVRALAVSTERRDPAAFRRALGTNQNADARFNDLARRIGFSVCGYPPAP